MKVLNKYGKEVNILHFQGASSGELKRTLSLVFYQFKLEPLENNLAIVSCWTDWRRCLLGHQLKRYNIPLINAVPSEFNSKWDMRKKIKFYIDCLENIKEDIVLLLDAYDVVLTSTKDIVEKFKAQPYRILFNTSVNNYPNVNIDKIPKRKELDSFSHFLNAGCCIGYREDLTRFYKECYEFIDIPNKHCSEQFVVRHAFAKYSEDLNQRFIWLDFKRDIFNTMAGMKCTYNHPVLSITDNDLLCLVLASDDRY